MNKSFRKILGSHFVPEDQSAKEVLMNIRSDEVVRDRINMLNQVYSSEEPVVINEFKTQYDKSGSGVLEDAWFNVIYQPMEHTGGKVYGIFIAGFEVTELVRAREQIIYSQQRLALALKGARMGFWEFDVDNDQLDHVTDQFNIHYGFEPQKTLNQADYFNAIHPEDRQLVMNKINEVIENKGSFEVDYRVVWPDKSVHWIKALGQCLYNQDGRMYRRIGITMDITQRKEAEHSLMEAVKMRDDFLSIASHELQTPVTSIKARTELFQRLLKDNGNESYIQEADKIAARVNQLSQLTGSLLDISRMQEGKLKLEKQDFLIDELFEDLEKTFRNVSHHKIIWEGQTGQRICADRFRIRQVLSSLIENAIKYSPDADRVILRVSEDADNVSVSVVDFGIGLPEKDRENVFKRFYKGSNGDRQTYPGFGVGLYKAAQIVQHHDGIIWVGDNPETGSVFTFTIPRGN